MSFEENVERQRAIIEAERKQLKADSEQQKTLFKQEIEPAHAAKEAELKTQGLSRIEMMKADPRFAAMMQEASSPQLKAIIYLYWERFRQRQKRVTKLNFAGRNVTIDVPVDIPFQFKIEPSFKESELNPAGTIAISVQIEEARLSQGTFNLYVEWHKDPSRLKEHWGSAEKIQEGVIFYIPHFDSHYVRGGDMGGSTEYSENHFYFSKLDDVIAYVRSRISAGIPHLDS